MSSAMPRVAILTTVPSKPASPTSRFEPPPSDQQRFVGGIQVSYGLDQLGLRLDSDHPPCRTADPQRRVIGQARPRSPVLSDSSQLS